LDVGRLRWTYYRLGKGPVLVWLTGGIRRAAYGYASLERLAADCTIIAPDYPPMMTYEEFEEGLSAILAAEGFSDIVLGGQSYGGTLAQAFLAGNWSRVRRVILSSSTPMDYGVCWLPLEYLVVGLAHILPEQKVKSILASGLVKVVTARDEEQADWAAALRETFASDLTRADVISHFSVAADIIRRRLVSRARLQDWSGRVVVLQSENDPTQSRNDRGRYLRLYAERVTIVSMGRMGHTAAIFDPCGYAQLVLRAMEG
jgi:pimeloyl-ACP methyl ester carboxylesterase